MGGEIGVLSAPGVGSTFRFTLRLRPGSGDGAAAAPAPSASAPGESRPLRVLIAEDVAVNQTVTRRLLADEGHEVDVVSNGAEALAALRAASYDVVLMDVRMLEKDGLSATAAIQRMPPPLGRVPVIAVTAEAKPGDEARNMEAGFDAYVTKPVLREQLLQAMAVVMRAVGASDPSASPAG